MTSYDFTPYKERVLNLVRERFVAAAKQSSPMNLENICRDALEQMGLPVLCPLREPAMAWLNNVYHLDFIKDHLQTPSLKELILHSHNLFQIQAQTRSYQNSGHLNAGDFQMALEIFAQKNFQNWNYSQPYCSFQTTLFGKPHRATLCHFDLTPGKNSKAFFRVLRPDTFALKDFGLNPDQVEFFHKALREKRNMVVAGATGSGKTSLLGSLIDGLPPSEHTIILEDTYELVRDQKHITTLIAGEGRHKSLQQYCAYALRMKPDRMIVGEIRSSEVIPFLLASNVGHRGLMASLHANRASDALSRLCLLFQLYAPQKGLSYPEILKLVCQGLDFVVYCQSQKVTEVVQVLGSEGPTPYYRRVF